MRAGTRIGLLMTVGASHVRANQGSPPCRRSGPPWAGGLGIGPHIAAGDGPVSARWRGRVSIRSWSLPTNDTPWASPRTASATPAGGRFRTNRRSTPMSGTPASWTERPTEPLDRAHSFHGARRTSVHGPDRYASGVAPGRPAGGRRPAVRCLRGDPRGGGVPLSELRRGPPPGHRPRAGLLGIGLSRRQRRRGSRVTGPHVCHASSIVDRAG